MTKHSIYFKGKNHSVEEALEMLTDEWIDDGAHCTQTVIDLRDALKFYIEECKKLKKQIVKDTTPSKLEAYKKMGWGRMG